MIFCCCPWSDIFLVWKLFRHLFSENFNLHSNYYGENVGKCNFRYLFSSVWIGFVFIILSFISRASWTAREDHKEYEIYLMKQDGKWNFLKLCEKIWLEIFFETKVKMNQKVSPLSILSDISTRSLQSNFINSVQRRDIWIMKKPLAMCSHNIKRHKLIFNERFFFSRCQFVAFLPFRLHIISFCSLFKWFSKNHSRFEN